MPIWFFFALATAFFWSIGQVLSKKGLENISALWSNIFSNMVGLFLFIPVVLLITRGNLTIPTPFELLLIFLTGLCYMSYFYAISRGKLALTSTLFETYPLITILLSYIFLHERINSLQLIGIFITLVGCVFVAWPEKIGKVQEYSWIFWGLVGAALEGIGDFFAKVTIVHIGPFSQIFFLVLLFQIASISNYIFDKKGRKLPKFSLKKFWPSLIGNGMVVTGTAFLFLALNTGKASLVTPVTAIAPVIVVLLAVIFLKERISRRQIFGIAAVIVGILFVGL